jgi:hypothetical protein
VALPLHIRRCRTARNVIMNANRAADAATGDLSGGTVTWTTAGGARHTAPLAGLYAN